MTEIKYGVGGNSLRAINGPARIGGLVLKEESKVNLKGKDGEPPRSHGQGHALTYAVKVRGRQMAVTVHQP